LKERKILNDPKALRELHERIWETLSQRSLPVGPSREGIPMGLDHEGLLTFNGGGFDTLGSKL
jgi:hypothetical protein